MNTVWKVAVGLVILLMLPVAAYAVGSVTAPPDGPAPRPAIRITDPAPTTTSERRQSSAADDAPSDERRKPKPDRDAQDDDVQVVTPRPAAVGEDDADDGGSGGQGDDGDDSDDSDDGGSGGDDD